MLVLGREGIGLLYTALPQIDVTHIVRALAICILMQYGALPYIQCKLYLYSYNTI